MPIRGEWLTAQERRVLVEALDHYETELNRRYRRTRSVNTRTETRWRQYLVASLRQDTQS